MWQVKTIENCPVTRGSLGVVRMPPWIIGEIAGAVEEEDEWALLLKGRSERGGLEIIIEDFAVPDWQEREGTRVHLPPRVLGPEWIGVAHLHPGSIGPGFSSTDDEEYNTRFRFSIVVSPKLRSNLDHHLGFSYSAVTRFQLPCGDMGVAEVKLVPIGEEEGSPFWAEAKIGSHGDEKEGLGDCDRKSVEFVGGDRFKVESRGSCGMTFAVRGPGFRSFGRGRGQIVERLPKPVERRIKGYRQIIDGSVVRYVPESAFMKSNDLKERSDGWYRDMQRDWEDREIEELYDRMDARAAELEQQLLEEESREEEEKTRLMLRGA